ncbi:MAG: hypothetical protein MUC98_04195 [Desulfobacterota bacterium]|nr:hypothetical protein [Thermodesulfobacteriota bacterium]
MPFHMILDKSKHRPEITAEIASVKGFAGYQDLNKKGRNTSAGQEHWQTFQEIGVASTHSLPPLALCFGLLKRNDKGYPKRVAKETQERYLRPIETGERSIEKGGKLDRKVRLGLLERNPRGSNLPYHQDGNGHHDIVIAKLQNSEIRLLKYRQQTVLRIAPPMVQDLIVDTPKSLKGRDRHKDIPPRPANSEHLPNEIDIVVKVFQDIQAGDHSESFIPEGKSVIGIRSDDGVEIPSLEKSNGLQGQFHSANLTEFLQNLHDDACPSADIQKSNLLKARERQPADLVFHKGLLSQKPPITRLKVIHF